MVTIDHLLGDVVSIGIALSGEHTLDSLFDLILSSARRITGAEAGTLYIREAGVLRFAVVQNEVLARRRGAAEMKRLLTSEALSLETPGLAANVARTGEILNVADAYRIPADRPYTFKSRFDARHQYRSRSLLVAPLIEPPGRVIGVLQLINARDATDQPTTFDHHHEAAIKLLAAQAAVALRNAQLEEASIKDALTDAYNRRYFELRLTEELTRAARLDNPVAVVMFDLDHFKAVNDSYGHRAGDAVLGDVAQLIVNQSRQYTRQSQDGLLRAADAALYDAKRAGRNVACGAQSGRTA